LIDRVGFFEHSRALDEHGSHAIGDHLSGGVEDVEAWSVFDRTFGDSNAGG
jgi:hypothetical protein